MNLFVKSLIKECSKKRCENDKIQNEEKCSRKDFIKLCKVDDGMLAFLQKQNDNLCVNVYLVDLLVLARYLFIRHLLRFFDCLAHPNLSATFATDQK